MSGNLNSIETDSIRNIVKNNISALLLTGAKKAAPERFFVTQINDKYSA
jgi:hypothetical protein